MSGKKSVIVKDVSMKFNLSAEKYDSLKVYFIKLLKRQLHYNEFWALNNVSFELEPGDRLGILGLNGAGKSTLLKAIAGVYKPTKGKIVRKGKIAPLLELGAGFEKEYTARENIYLYGAILGYTKEFIDSKFDEIIEFAELEKFVDDSGVSFLTDQGKTVSLNTMYTGLSTPDSLHKESYIFSTVFRLSQNDIELLHSNRITDIRIRYLGGSFDMEIPEKKRDLIIRMFNCIEETIKE